MPVLKVWGYGKLIQFKEVDKSTAKKYSETGVISQSEEDDFENNAEKIASGFNSGAVVYIDDKEIGNIADLIALGQDSVNYELLFDAVSSNELDDMRNALVREETYKGTFVKFEIKNYQHEKEVLSKEFISDFMINLSSDTGNLFSITTWNGEEIFEDDIDCKSDDYYIICDGKWQELKIK